MMNQYLCLLRSMFDTHRSQGHLALLTEDLMNEQLKGLTSNMKTWNKIVFKLQFKERVDSEFLPSKILIKISKIDACLYNTNSGTNVYGTTAIHNCFYSLYTLHMADLCNFKCL